MKCVLKNVILRSKKSKGEICCGGHLAVTYGGELLYLWIFRSCARQAISLSVCHLSCLDLKSHLHLGYRMVKDAAAIMCSSHKI